MKIAIKNSNNFYTTYFVDEQIRKTILIVPGGAYKYTSVRESECVAKEFNLLGYHAIVINYREDIELFPAPIETIEYVIKDIVKYDCIDYNNLISLGFSAGGHAVLSQAIYSKFKPKLLVLCYPVITSNPKYFNKLSFETLLGEEFNNLDLLKKVSLEKHIKKNIPDTFLWHTLTDESVPVENSLLLVNAYRKAKANIEFHMFPFGGHGLSLANDFTALGDPKKKSEYIGRWINLVDSWIKEKTK